MKPQYKPGDYVEVNAPGVKRGTFGRVVRNSWRTDNRFFVVSVWIACDDMIIEASERHLKRIEPKQSEQSAKRWKK